MTNGIYHWEIYDSMSGLVVSKGIGEKEGQKTLSYLRSVYGCYLNIRPASGKANPTSKWQEMYDFFESVSWPDDVQENAVTTDEMDVYPAMFRDTDKDGIPDIDDPHPYEPHPGDEPIEKDILLSDEAAKIMDIRREYDPRRKEEEGRIKGKHPDWDVSSRLKTLYSIISKLRKSRMTNDPEKKFYKGLKDIAGLRVIAKDYKDLLQKEKELKDLYGARLKRDDNFYRKHKKGYRAIHYTIDPKTVWPMEIQLITRRQRKLSKVCHSLMKRGTFDAKEMNHLSKIAARADRGHAKSQKYIDELSDTQILEKLSGQPSVAPPEFVEGPYVVANPKEHKQVKNPTGLADTLDVFFQEPMSSVLQEKKQGALKKIQKKLRSGERLSRSDLDFLGDAMKILMLKGLLTSVSTPFGLPSAGLARANPIEIGEGRIRQIGETRQTGNFPVWFESSRERPVLFDASFRSRPEMRVGENIRYEYFLSSGGWKIVNRTFRMRSLDTTTPSIPPPTTDSPLSNIDSPATFTTGYITKPRGAEESQTPYRMAWSPSRGQYMVGSVPNTDGLKLGEDVIDTFNENRISLGLPKILPSYGQIAVTGRIVIERGKRIFAVSKIDSFTPQTEERSVTVPLTELVYGLNEVSFDKDDHVGVLNSNLGFDSHPSLNTIKHKFNGSVTIRGQFKKEGSWDRYGEHFYHYYLGNTAEWTPSVIDDLKRVIRTEIATQRIQQLVERYYREGRAVSVEHLRGEIQDIYNEVYGPGARDVTTTEAETSLVTRRTDYEMEYIELLKAFQREMGGEYLYIPTAEGEPEFVFVINDMLILEIPITNKASYIFHLDHEKGIEQQATDIRAVPQRSAIYLDPAIKAELKFEGRTIHRTPEGWIDRLKEIVRAQSAQENPKSDGVDEDMVRELVLYATNDSQLYHNYIQPRIRMLANHTIRQEFDREKAVQAFANMAKDIQAKYWREFGEGTPPAMNQATKTAIGLGLYESAEEEINYVVKGILTGERTRRGAKIERPNPDANIKVVQLKYTPPSEGGQ